MDDLEERRSLVRVIDTGEAGLFVGMRGELYSVKFLDGTYGAFEESQLRYLGTPGVDCPYLDDYL